MRRPMIFTALALTAACAAASASAQDVVALSATVTWEGPDGARTLEVTPGERLAVMGPQGAGFAFEQDGTLGVLLNENLAAQVSPDGCFALSLSNAYESDLVEVEVRGREMPLNELLQGHHYQGPSLTLKAEMAASAELEAGVELCFQLEPGALLEPDDRGTQRMTVAGFTQPEESGWSVRTSISAGFTAETGLETTLEAYCADEDLDPPTAEVVFAPLDERFEPLPALLSEIGDDFDDIGSCVWAARSLDPDYAEAFLATLAAAGRSPDWPSAAGALAEDCYFEVGPASVSDCVSGVLATFGFPGEGEPKGAAAAILAAWIEARREEKLATCVVEICDAECRSTRERLTGETIRSLVSAAQQSPVTTTKN